MSIAEPLQLAVIIGSTRVGRFGPVPAAWFADQARQRADMSVDVIDLAETKLPDVITGDDDPEPDSVVQLQPRLAEADAFVVVTPEYNHSFNASLKAAIDWYHAEWAAKPVGFISYGGMSGGIRAVEQLRQVFPELHAVTMRDSLSFHNYPDKFDAAGLPIELEDCNGAAKGMLDQLAWWGHALRNHRNSHPYDA